jgi:HSP20 family protein
MAQQVAAMSQPKESSPTINVGIPNDGIKERFTALARRAFEIFESSGHSFGNDINDWFQAERELFHPAHINLSETEDSFTVRAEVPGFTANELEINLEGRRLTVSGKREKHEERKDKRMVYSETCSDEILRVLDLPAEVEAESAEATLKDGILELELAKAAPARKVPIAPKAA